MESSKPSLTNRKWLLFTLASFLSFLFLSRCLNQSHHQLGAILSSSLQNLKSPESGSTSVSITKLPNRELVRHYTAIEVVPSPNSTTDLSPKPAGIEEKAKSCDYFDGKWVYDQKAFPLYHWHQCPFLDAQVNCLKNGRPDSGYQHWRWEARECQIPRFNGSYMLERLRGKRVAIIGDSLNRNQWESLACLLYSSLRPSRATVKVYSNDMIFRAIDYDFSLEFFWSPFLVRLDEMNDQSKVLKLEKLPMSARQWQGADVMVFNTGHWWTHSGRMRTWKFFEWKGQLVEDMDGDTAFEIALKTWARWIDRMKLDPAKTTVFFRSLSPEHKRESRQWCYNQTHPMTNETYKQWFPRSMTSIVERTIQEMRTPVKYLNITRLSEYRRDAHTSVYTVRQWKLLTKEQRKQPEIYADCSHWCLPGLPDTWNILLYASLFETPSILS